MADMDVWSQIMQLGSDFTTKHYRQLTKITVGQGISRWLVDYVRRMQPAAGSDAAITSLQGVPLVVNDEFWPGQCRIHCGEEFEDHFVSVPPTLSGHVFFAKAGEDRWRSLGIARDLTIQSPGA